MTCTVVEEVEDRTNFLKLEAKMNNKSIFLCKSIDKTKSKSDTKD